MKSIFPRHIVIHRKITWLLLFSIATLALVSWLIFVNKENVDKANFRISQTYEIIGKIQETIIVLSESKTVPAHYLTSLQYLTRENNDLRNHLAILGQYLLEKRTDSVIKPLLYAMLDEERNLLSTRKHLNDLANQRTAYALIVARLAAFLFVVTFLILLNQDITRHKATQQKLIIAVGEAQKAKQMQEQFLANMSHEIRTPMNGIKGMTDLLQETSLSEKQKDITGLIKRSIDNLMIIINDILDFSKIQAGMLRIEKIDLSVKEVVNSAAFLFAHRLKAKGLQLHVEISPDIPGQLVGDPHRLNQVLTNLLSNAIKFTDQGNIQVKVDLKQLSADNVMLSFTIADTGIGIPTGSLPHIFDSFSQVGSDTSRRYGGTGLGLTICKQLVHLQGGEISVTSIVGEGSEFQFNLPFGYSDKPTSERAAGDTLQDYSQLLAGKHFLVAEDNEINQVLINHVLSKAGGSVTMANNGAEAVNFLSEDNVFDLIIMDLQMPEMDGFAATRHIRNNLNMQTPIIAMTATAMKDEQWQCLDSGMNEYMTKPFEFTDLYKKILHLLPES
jgi:signal transduction histidine kinase